MDPTIQTFCCHHSNESLIANLLIRGFDTDSYNAVCMFSSILGIFGAIYQVLPRAELTPIQRRLQQQQQQQQHQQQQQNWFLSSTSIITTKKTRSRQIIIWLAIADLLASFGVFLRSTLWLNSANIIPSSLSIVEDDYDNNNNNNNDVLFCSISSAFIQYFYTSTWLWTLCYAIYMRRILQERESKILYYHLISWCIPALLTIIGLSFLYLPDANCHMISRLKSTTLTILPNYLITYIPILLIMIINPILYHYSINDMEIIVTSTSGQFTTRERTILDAVKMKFIIINMIFYICWLPNLFNGILLLLWTLSYDLPTNLIITLWYVMAFMNPLQAFFNCLVYRRWISGSERIVLPWCKRNENVTNDIMLKTTQNQDGGEQQEQQQQYNQELSSDSNVGIHEEILPLLQNTQSINGYKLYTS